VRKEAENQHITLDIPSGIDEAKILLEPPRSGTYVLVDGHAVTPLRTTTEGTPLPNLGTGQPASFSRLRRSDEVRDSRMTIAKIQPASHFQTLYIVCYLQMVLQAADTRAPAARHRSFQHNQEPGP
jgi:hypothetical protein